MPTDQDSSQNRRAAHFSGATRDDSSGNRPRRMAHQRGATNRSDTGRRTRSSRGGSTRSSQSLQNANQVSERTARATQRAAAARERRASAGGKKGGNKRSGGSTPFAAVLALVVVLAAVGVGFLIVPRLFQRDDTTQTVDDYPAGEQVVVVVPDGASGAQIAQLLLESHVISDEAAFYQEVQHQNADARMKSGSYMFVTGATISEVVRQLVDGPNASEYQFRLAEGLTVAQTAASIEKQVDIPADDFIAQAKATNYVDDYPFLDNVSDDSLEGYLYAKTYDFGGKDVSADAAIRMMLDQYQAEVGGLDFDAARESLKERYNIEISNYGILKVASIIDREAVTEEQRPLVASVIYNRLSIGMALQSDATMMYVTGGEVTAADLQTESPYNTYLNTGLTPTPICSPRIESIKAAMSPDDTDYLYFFINDAVQQFSVTYEEHQQAIRDSLYG